MAVGVAGVFIAAAFVRILRLKGAGEAAEAKSRLFEGSPATIRRLEGEAALSPSAIFCWRSAIAFIIGGQTNFFENQKKIKKAIA